MSRKERQRVKISKASFKRSLRILRYIKPYRGIFTVGMVLLLASTLLTLVITRLLGLLAGNGFADTDAPSMPPGIANFVPMDLDWSTIGDVSIVLGIALLLQGAVSFLRVYIFAYVTENAMLHLRKDTFERLVRMPMQFFHESKVGDLNSRISADISLVQETLSTTFPEIIRGLITVFVGVGALLIFSSELTLYMLASIPVVMIVAVLFGRFIRKLSKTTQDKVADSNVIVQESLSGIVNVKSFANERFETNRYFSKLRDIKGFAMRGALWRGAFSTFIVVFMFGAIAFIIKRGAHLAENGEINPDLFFTFLLFTGLIAGSIGGLASQFGSLQRGIGAIENTLDTMEKEIEEIALTQESAEKGNLGGGIVFKDVRFTYPSRPDIEVIQGISFEVKSGEQVALVGSSGAGKSTIAGLLQRFYNPSAGHLLFDGKTADSFDLTYLRSQMAFVPQEVILFGGTIKENIAYGKTDATAEEILEAARKANAMEFIEKFSEGLETLVGDRGIQLSGGQKQRIAIARALLKDPTILILDEATSALDSESERLVQEALERLMANRTSIVIAHRLSTIRKADKIVVLEQGKIAEEGTHDALVSKENGVYKHLSELQLG